MRGIKGYVKLISGLLAFLAFLALNLITVAFGEQSFLNVLLSSGFMMICWIMIRDSFAEQGLISGQKDIDVKATKKEHLITSNEISTYKEDFNIWCERKNADRLKEKRIAILTGSSVIYDDFFDVNGNLILDENNKPLEVERPKKSGNRKADKIALKRYKKDCKLLNKARFAFVPPYEVEDICAKEDISTKKKLFGVSVKHWKNLKVISSVIFSLVISVMLSFISVSGRMLGDADIIILVFELLIMAGSALSFYFSALNFICGEWREGLIQKTRVMEEFYRNVVGTITYENDVKNPDGTIVCGKKVFTRKSDYKPLKEEKEKDPQLQASKQEVENECRKQQDLIN